MSNAIAGPYIWDRRGDSEISLEIGQCVAYKLSDGNEVRIKTVNGQLIIMSDNPIVVAPRASNSFAILSSPA